MSRGLYSDPFLKALLEKEPKLAMEFLESIANSKYVSKDEVVSCIDVPGWVLEKAGIAGFINPNFPSKEFEKFLEDEDLVSKHFWATFEYPNLNQKQVKKLIKNRDENVRALALAHPLGDPIELLMHLKLMISNQTHSSFVMIYISQNVVLIDEVFAYLFSVADYEGSSKTVGQALWDNPTLSDEQKAALVLSGIQPKDESATDYWRDSGLHFVSSIPYLQLFKVSFYYSKDNEAFREIPRISSEVENFFSSMGHHLSLLLTEEVLCESIASIEGLYDLSSLQLMNRLFWSDLCERDDFAINRRNTYSVDDVFISHPILGREFDEGDVAQTTRLGGVFIFNFQNWLRGESELSADRAAGLLNSYGELVTIFKDGNYESIGQSLIALSYEVPGISEKYGFEVTEGGYDWMVEAALEIAEGPDFDVSAKLNPYFGETLSWAKLPDSKKEKLFEFLSLGFNHKESKLRSDSIHFLGCMALHEGTPQTILQKLAELGDPLVDEVLASREI